MGSCNGKGGGGGKKEYQVTVRTEGNTKKSEFHYVLAMIGDVDVGKTSLMVRFTENKWDENPALDLNNQDERKTTFEHDGNTIHITVRDTGGQERYRAMTAYHYRRAQGVIIMYDITSKKSFKNLPEWLVNVEGFSENVCKIIIGNKSDLSKQRQVSQEELKEFAEQGCYLYQEVSAKTGDGVAEAFKSLILEIYNKNENV